MTMERQCKVGDYDGKNVKRDITMVQQCDEGYYDGKTV